MKKILAALVIVALLVLAFQANAQSYSYQSLTVPTVTAAATSNSLGVVIYTGRQKDVCLSWNTGATNITVRLSGSVDNVNYDTNRYVLNLTTFPTITNLTVNGLGYLRIDSVLSTGTINATNTVAYGVKSGAP